MLKRLFSIITISLVLTGSFFSAYNIKYPVYADSTTDQWTQVTTNQQLVEAFKYYCKSRDLTIEGSVADAVTSFTTKTFNGICNTLGIDITALQAEIKYQTDGNLGNRFLFSALGIDAYNRIFAQFLQDNDLAVGDENVNIEVESGVWFTDADGNGCWCFIDNNSSFSTAVNVFPAELSNTTISAIGTSYKNFVGSSIYNSYSSSGNGLLFTNTCNFNNNTSYNLSFYKTQNSSYSYMKGIDVNYNYYNSSGSIYTAYDGYNGYVGISFYSKSGTNFGYWIVTYRQNRSDGKRYGLYYLYHIDNSEKNETSVNIVSTVINNNTYEGDTIINNNGDTNNYPDNPDNPDNPDPPTIPDSGGWQDFTLPEMPNNWLIYGMEKKFPFDIPFNILFGLSLLNHEPEIPKFEGDIDLKVCTWHYDIDLTPFDDIAKILRKFEVLAFIIGLAMITKELIMWG